LPLFLCDSGESGFFEVGLVGGYFDDRYLIPRIRTAEHFLNVDPLLIRHPDEDVAVIENRPNNLLLMRTKRTEPENFEKSRAGRTVLPYRSRSRKVASHDTKTRTTKAGMDHNAMTAKGSKSIPSTLDFSLRENHNAAVD